MQLRPASLCFAAVLFLVFSPDAICRASELDAAIAKSRESGAPLFVLVTSPYCGPCTTLKRRLETDEELQKLIDQYVGIHFDVNDPAYRQWTEKYKPHSRMVPMIFVVSSSGKVIYNDSGAPRGNKLVQLLRYGLSQNANQAREAEETNKTEGEWRAVGQAAEAFEAKRYAEAIRALKPFLSDDEPRPAGNRETAEQLASLRQKLHQLARTQLDEAQAKLASRDKKLFGYLALAQTRRQFGELPEVADEIERTYGQFRDDASKADWFAQVETIDLGRAAEREGDYDTAIDRYREVMANYPDAKAAQLCSIRIQQLARERVATLPSARDAAAESR